MIITQTPLRISFLGGGTDLPVVYERDGGAVLNSAIDKYIYVVAKTRFDDRLRLGYTQTELVDDVSDLEHDLAREAFRLTGVTGGVEVASLGDIPTRGSGLGSSSTVTVGLLHAIWVLRGQLPSRSRLAEAACEVELDRLGRPMGKQDQYAAAFGGLRYTTFAANGVTVGELVLDATGMRRLSESLLLFFTGMTRQSHTVLAEQAANSDARRQALARMRDMAAEGRDALVGGELDTLGELLHEGWQLKRTLASGITRPEIDEMYEAARAAGALGGKICGAGGGGFLLLYCRPEAQHAVRDALGAYSELSFALEADGTRVLMNVPRAPAWAPPVHRSDDV